jgi:8-oxo-dGTP pyrophosphatase MutT (NUDIX family)
MNDMTLAAKQYAALPVRRVGGKLEVLLVSSRETRRWVIPKGWPMAGRSEADSAAQEAFEEAGVEGTIAAKPIGSFAYGKRKKSGATVPLTVDVFRLDVRREHDAWPEANERTRKWMTPEQAADAVAEPELSALLLKLA